MTFYILELIFITLLVIFSLVSMFLFKKNYYFWYVVFKNSSIGLAIMVFVGLLFGILTL